MAKHVLIRHKVKDYDAWKPGFDSHEPARKSAGLSVEKVMRGAKDPNEVFVLFGAEDFDRAREFAQSADLKETMLKFGVVDEPSIWMISD